MPTALTEQRKPDYQSAWSMTGELLANPYVQKGLQFISFGCPHLLFPWIMILNKLVRALSSPTQIDHWEDIIGYATLARDELAQEAAKDDSA